MYLSSTSTEAALLVDNDLKSYHSLSKLSFIQSFTEKIFIGYLPYVNIVLGTQTTSVNKTEKNLFSGTNLLRIGKSMANPMGRCLKE